jgi:hypothetical protein
LIPPSDDGIVVVGQDNRRGKGQMKSDFVLRARLGEDGVRALAAHLEEQGETWRSDVIDACFDRFDVTLQKRFAEMDTRFANRLAETESRLSERITANRVEFLDRLGDLRAELLRWTFGFWVGQAVVISGAIAVLVQLLAR